MVSLAKHVWRGPYDSNTAWKESMGTFSQFSAVDIDGKNRSFAEFKNQVALVINVACK
jgi:hypothetical protein